MICCLLSDKWRVTKGATSLRAMSCCLKFPVKQTHNTRTRIHSHSNTQPTSYLSSRADSGPRLQHSQHTGETSFYFYFLLMQLLSVMCFGGARQFDYQSNTHSTLNTPWSPGEEGAKYFTLCWEMCHVLWTHNSFWSWSINSGCSVI